jgi:uncharacterized protein (DUF1778 family)
MMRHRSLDSTLRATEAMATLANVQAEGTLLAHFSKDDRKRVKCAAEKDGKSVTDFIVAATLNQANERLTKPKKMGRATTEELLAMKTWEPST